MEISKMSTSSRQHILANWVELYRRTRHNGDDQNGVVRQCTASFPAFGDRMRTNLRVVGVDKAFERSMTEIVMGSEPRAPRPSAVVQFSVGFGLGLATTLHIGRSNRTLGLRCRRPSPVPQPRSYLMFRSPIHVHAQADSDRALGGALGGILTLLIAAMLGIVTLAV